MAVLVQAVVSKHAKGWHVLRMNETHGDSAGPFRTLSEAFAFVLAGYNEDGSGKKFNPQMEDEDELPERRTVD